jgi:hypothetical protein
MITSKGNAVTRDEEQAVAEVEDFADLAVELLMPAIELKQVPLFAFVMARVARGSFKIQSAGRVHKHRPPPM